MNQCQYFSRFPYDMFILNIDISIGTMKGDTETEKNIDTDNQCQYFSRFPHDVFILKIDISIGIMTGDTENAKNIDTDLYFLRKIDFPLWQFAIAQPDSRSQNGSYGKLP